MAFPIYQRTERMKYPDASSMVVNWAGAFDKITEGMERGVELGLKIKESRENSLLTAARIKQIEQAVASQVISTEISQKESEATLALNAAQQRELDARFARDYSEAAVNADKQKKANELDVINRQGRASGLLNLHTAQFNDMMTNRANLEMRLDQTTDPSERQMLIDEWKQEYSEFGEALGVMEPASLILDLPQGDPRSAALAGFHPLTVEKQYLSNMLVPMSTTVVEDVQYHDMLGDGDGGEGEAFPMSGKQSFTKATAKLKMVPLSEAKMYWLRGDGVETFRMLERSAASPEAFKTWAEKNRLGGLLSSGAPARTEAASVSPIPETPAQERGEKVVATVAGKKVQIDRPTGILGGVRTKVTAGATWDSIYAGSPVGKMKKKLNILNPIQARMGDQGLELGPEFTFAQDKKFREKNLSYFIEKKKAMQESMRGQSPDQRAVTSRVIDRMQLYINRLKRDYGVEGDLGDESATKVAAKVTKDTVRLYNPQKKQYYDVPVEDEPAARKAGYKDAP